MKLYLVTITEVYSDQDTLEVTPYVNSKAFKTFEEAKEDMISKFKNNKASAEKILEEYILQYQATSM